MNNNKLINKNFHINNNLNSNNNLNLKKISSIKIGYKTNNICFPESFEDIISSLNYAKKNNLKYFITGGNTNILFHNKNLNIFIIDLIKFNNITFKNNTLFLQAGVLSSFLASLAYIFGISDFEFLHLLPGTIGGAIYMNARCYNGEIKDIIKSVKTLNIIYNNTILKSIKNNHDINKNKTNNIIEINNKNNKNNINNINKIDNVNDINNVINLNKNNINNINNIEKNNINNINYANNIDNNINSKRRNINKNNINSIIENTVNNSEIKFEKILYNKENIKFDYKYSDFQINKQIILEMFCNFNTQIKENIVNNIIQYIRNELLHDEFKLFDIKYFYKTFSLNNLNKILSKLLKNKQFSNFLTNINRNEIEKKMKLIEEDRVRKKHFEYPSLGSIFKNNYNFGIPTGKIIEELGLKGYSINGAQISPFHGNIIINKKNASSTDLIKLINLVKLKVKEKHSLELEEEIIII